MDIDRGVRRMPVFFTHSEPLIFEKQEGGFHSHSHYEAELKYIVKGKYRVISEGNVYDLEEGDIWIGFPFVEHSFEDVGDNVVMLAIFSPDDVGALSKLLSGCRPEYPVVNLSELPPGFGDELVRIAQLWMTTVNRKYNSPDFWDKVVEDVRFRKFSVSRENVLAYLSAAVGELLGAMKLKPIESTRIDSIQRIMRYCTENILDPELSMQKLSSAIGLSRSQISRLMSQMMKMSFPKFLHSIRINKARRLLRYTEKPITEIAFECGFMSQRSFNRVFRSIIGITPTEYRGSHDSSAVSYYYL